MMSFASLEFIFRFLPIFFILYFALPVKYREITLLIGSLFFYALGEPVFIFLLMLLTVLNYYWGQKIWKLGQGFEVREWQCKQQKKAMLQAIILDVSVLVVFKCISTLIDQSLLPVGLSFYIFKMISFQIDLVRREIQGKPTLIRCALYFCLFPQVVSGPIMRYGQGEFELERTCSWEQLEDGLKYFVVGLGMKVLLADRLSILWNDLQMIGFQSISTPLAWLGAVGFSLQLYFDFWGYSLMASGLMVILGFEFVENFNHPYASKSISEFYRRWHMTLGSWFRDYIYFSMGGSRCSGKRLVFNLAVVWLLTGFWHGNGMNYLIWGAILGMLVILEKKLYGSFLQKVPILGNIYVIVLIPLTWVVFAITNLKQLGVYLGRLFPMVGGPGVAVNSQDIIKYAQNYAPFLIVGVILCIPAVMNFFEKHKKNPIVVLLLTVVFWISIYFVASSTGNPFMYLKF